MGGIQYMTKRKVTESEYEFNQRWYKSLCERRLQLMRSEAFYAKQRREIERAIILFQVDGRWNGKYIKDPPKN